MFLGERKPKQTQGEHVKPCTDSNLILESNQEPWSCDVATLPTVPIL